MSITLENKQGLIAGDGILPVRMAQHAKENGFDVICISLADDNYNELKKYTDNYLFEKNWGYGNLLNEFDVRAINNDTVYLGWNDIKWYDYEDYEDVNAIVYGLKHLEENDYSYRFARLGEDYDDFEEKYYDSDSEKENHLEFPSVLREFEDEYIMDLLKVNDNLEK